MVGKQLLPLIGGAPGVWNVCLLFFQVALLLGYALADRITRLRTGQRQLIVYSVFLVVGLAVLPIHFRAPAGEITAPTTWLFLQLSRQLMLPFVALSAAGPLMQHWFARISARDPYTLYAASNAGSFGALVSYPFLIEPALPLHTQAVVWLALYVAVSVLLISAGWMARKSETSVQPDAAATEHVNAPRQVRWILLAFFPSSLLLGVTSFITSDLAPIPLLWVIPLALYLLTFIVAFGRLASGVPSWLERGCVLLLIAWAVLYRSGATSPLAVIIIVYLLLFCALALACHSRLVASRPPPAQLTRFYLLIALGGALGGAFNALIAPLLFDSFAEYPIAALLAFAVFHDWTEIRWQRKELLLLVAYVLVVFGVHWIPDVQQNSIVARFVTIGVPALFAYLLSARPARYAIALAILLFTVRWDPRLNARSITSERNFFGVLRVTVDGSGRYYELRHGSTLHGAAEKGRRSGSEPLTYYSERSPVADLLRAGQTRADFRSVGVVGLGVGSLAWYARPTEQWTFFEINPAAERIARDPILFGFLTKSKASLLRIVAGDARLSLSNIPDASYDLLVLDAFNSDAIPLHLLSREAFELYLRKLKPRGVIAVHTSNRYLNLSTVLANTAASVSAIARERDDLGITASESANRITASVWVAVARSAEDFGGVQRDTRWFLLNPGKERVWTDDYSNVWRAWKR